MTLIKVPKHKEYICNICGETMGYHDRVYTFTSDKRVRAPKHTEHEELHMCDDCAERFFELVNKDRFEKDYHYLKTENGEEIKIIREKYGSGGHQPQYRAGDTYPPKNTPNCGTAVQHKRSELMQDIVNGTYNPYKEYKE